ncbi:o-succinylbenzoate synthase [Natronomonas halophila]|uniref:mandelate racemase/muconate lactonizing enzyme family protein n=1 Tax=Natronomonas halophila TaxID=2747817 RepID=UPI0015B78B07|nr:o-succinylbenzoate synthase [Natronomonas halophila]QLD84998.1 o-succinylbenzoate synthase [Natronomonas halophila]
MRIDPFSLSLSTPLETAAGTIDERRGFLVRLDIDGTPGLGEATPLPGWTESLDDCEAALRDVADPEAALDSGRLDGTPAARHGVSLAALDARARAADVPLYRYLGADSRIERVPVNATVGDDDAKATAEAAADAVAEGYPAVKLKVGSRSLSEDIDRLEAVRQRCPDIELRADANGAWDRETAERALSAFADLDVAFVEQPLPADDLSGHAALSGGTVGIALDEGLHEHGIDAVLEAGATDVVVCKPMALGGIDRAADVARRALDEGLDVVVTTTIDGAVARAAAVHLAAALPRVRACGLATRSLLVEDIRENVAPIRSGAAVVPQGKGNIPPS